MVINSVSCFISIPMKTKEQKVGRLYVVRISIHLHVLPRCYVSSDALFQCSLCRFGHLDTLHDIMLVCCIEAVMLIGPVKQEAARTLDTLVSYVPTDEKLSPEV